MDPIHTMEGDNTLLNQLKAFIEKWLTILEEEDVLLVDAIQILTAALPWASSWLGYPANFRFPSLNNFLQ